MGAAVDTECPECGLPAEIVDRFMLEGSPHSVEHVEVVCVAGHRFRPPADSLPGRDEQTMSVAAHAPLTGAEHQRNLPFAVAAQAGRPQSQ